MRLLQRWTAVKADLRTDDAGITSLWLSAKSNGEPKITLTATDSDG